MNDTKTVSGNIVHIEDGSEAPVLSLKVAITPKQSGSGTPSPDNVRPISGWESVDLWSGTANALDLSWWSGRTVNGITFTLQPNGKVRMHGTVTQAGWTFIDHEIDLPYNGIGAGNEILLYSDSQIFVRFYNGNTLVGDAVANNNSTVATIPTSATKMRVYIYAFGVVPTAGTTVDAERSFYLSRNTTFTEWQPYTGTTTPVNLGRTVYGGEAEIVGGSLTDKMAIVTLDGSSNITQRRAGTNNSLFGIDLASGQGGKAVAETSLPNVIANELPLETAYNAWRNETPLVAMTSTGNTIWFRLPNITELADAKSYLASNPLQVCYELATPQTYTLTPTEVELLTGANNVWADAGAILEMTYRTELLGIFGKILIDGRAYFRPNNFELKREDVYAGEYTTCTGKTIADKIGWKYSDLTLKWDILPDEDLAYLTTLTGTFSIAFRDSDGQHTEQVIRRGFTNTPTRITGPNGTKIWTELEMEISFLNTHPIGE